MPDFLRALWHSPYVALASLACFITAVVLPVNLERVSYVLSGLGAVLLILAVFRVWVLERNR